MEKDWRQAVVDPSATLEEAVRVITKGALRIALVVNDGGFLVGIITDGDLRRAIGRHIPMSDGLASVMNTSPITLQADRSREEMLSFMQKRSIEHLPLLNAAGRLEGFTSISQLTLRESGIDRGSALLIAGGFGKRLRPLTNDLPKPLVRVGGKPIIQHIIESLRDDGFSRLFISTHYKSRMITDYLGSGARFGVQIQYIHEETPLGTAGCIGHLPEDLGEGPLLVMNADLLTGISFRQLADFHVMEKSVATMCVRNYGVTIPFGVVSAEADQVVEKIEEKPTKNFLVNAGIYVLAKTVLNSVKRAEILTMPDLINRLLTNGKKVSTFPIFEDWIDVGTAESLAEARSLFDGVKDE